jgi:hypothetical protein
MDFTRQMTLCNPTDFKDKQVTIIGAGGIGAMTTLLLAKCGFEHLMVYDFDTLDEVNGPNQMLPIHRENAVYPTYFGTFKVWALVDLVYSMTSNYVEPYPYHYTNQPLSEVVISAVDSMAVRKDIWNAAKSDPNVAFLVDGRMGRESLAIYAVDLLDQANCESYEATLHDDSEALQIPCTEKATIFTNAQIASWITKIVTAWASGKEWKKVMRINMADYLVIVS